ncbi:MAG TPA: hypothetical protein VKR30_09485 [Candidatus Limnocylindrales bacterium]|nr:hypothetical protein [Candidatus Limnocylindrales bacterium]
METIAVVLSVKPDQVEAFEAGFREHELPIWRDFEARGVLTAARIARLDISSQPRGDAVQYLIVVDFPTGEGHHLHDNDPRFAEWNAMADAFQVGGRMAFGGKAWLQVGDPRRSGAA